MQNIYRIINMECANIHNMRAFIQFASYSPIHTYTHSHTAIIKSMTSRSCEQTSNPVINGQPPEKK